MTEYIVSVEMCLNIFTKETCYISKVSFQKYNFKNLVSKIHHMNGLLEK